MRLACALLALLAGCTLTPTLGPDAQGYTWARTMADIPRERWRVHVLGDVYLACALRPYRACVRREHGWCDIYLPKDATKWLVRHEEMHCEGWTHG